MAEKELSIDELLELDRIVFGTSYEKRTVDQKTGEIVRERLDPLAIIKTDLNKNIRGENA